MAARARQTQRTSAKIEPAAVSREGRRFASTSTNIGTRLRSRLLCGGLRGIRLAGPRTREGGSNRPEEQAERQQQGDQFPHLFPPFRVIDPTVQDSLLIQD